MGAMHIVFLIFSLTAFSHIAHSYNITEMLSRFPEYSVFNDYLTKTKLADAINVRVPITVLVLNNATARDIAKYPINAMKDVLSVHVLLEYFDKMKITELGTNKATTLYAGNAGGDNSFMNVTDFRNGKFGFGSQAVPGSAVKSTLVKEVIKEGNVFSSDFAVLEISKPITPPEVIKAAGPKPSDMNITRVLEDAWCWKFAELIEKTGLQNMFPEALKKGLTIFAPYYRTAFKDPNLPDLNNMTNDQLVLLLKYHFVGDYMPTETLHVKQDHPISTLATNRDGQNTLKVRSNNDEFAVFAGKQKCRVAGTLMDTAPLVIYQIKNIFIPSELFGKSQPPASDVAPAIKPGYSPPVAGVPALAPSAAGDTKLSGFVKTLIAVSTMVTLSTLSFY